MREYAMRKQMKPIIWTSKKPEPKEVKIKGKNEYIEIEDKQAATIERVETLDVPLIVDRTSTYEEEFLTTKPNKKEANHTIFIALIAALLIGSFLGVGILFVLGMI